MIKKIDLSIERPELKDNMHGLAIVGIYEKINELIALEDKMPQLIIKSILEIISSNNQRQEKEEDEEKSDGKTSGWEDW